MAAKILTLMLSLIKDIFFIKGGDFDTESPTFSLQKIGFTIFLLIFLVFSYNVFNNSINNANENISLRNKLDTCEKFTSKNNQMKTMHNT